MSENSLEVQKITKHYIDGDHKLEVLRGVNLSAKPGEIISITGQSGSGKSTILHLLGGLDRVTSGNIQFLGQELTTLSESALSQLRAKQIGIIFQFYHLLPEFTALENLIVPQLLVGISKSNALEKARAALDKVGLVDRGHHRPSKMSGGEQQRVAIARALMNNPKLILADEPTGNLDMDTGESIIELLWTRIKETNCTLLMVTHEDVLANRADHHLHLANGKLSERK